jgi:cytochrome oxidase Cu insertion factor (SCO1/SenC/PrrC family)
MSNDDEALRGARARGRRRLLAVAAVFLGPFVVATLLYHYGWQPGAQVNRGTLLAPPIPLPPFEASVLGIRAAAPAAGTWIVLVVSRAGCSSACRRSLDDTRRVLDLLGHDRDRVQRVLVGTGGVEAATMASHADIVGVDSSVASNGEILAALADAADGAVYVADPRRNLILRYAPGQDAKDLLDDLKRLLKYSG